MRESIKPALYFGTNHGKRVQHLLRACIISRRLEGKELMIKIAHSLFDLAEIHCERSVGIGFEATFIQEIVHLDRHPARVSLLQPKSQSAKRRSKKRGVEVALSLLSMGNSGTAVVH